MKKALSVAVTVFLVVMLITGVATATGNGAHEGANEAEHPHPEGMEHEGGHASSTAGLIAGIIGIPTLVGAGYLLNRRRQKKE